MSRTIILGAIDTSSVAISVLSKVADLARRTNGEAVIIHVTNNTSKTELLKLQLLANKLLLDIPHQFLTTTGSVSAEIIRLAQEHQVTDIVLGKPQPKFSTKLLTSSISQEVVQAIKIPVILVGSAYEKRA